jgi:hypothetical protein
MVWQKILVRTAECRPQSFKPAFVAQARDLACDMLSAYTDTADEAGALEADADPTTNITVVVAIKAMVATTAMMLPPAAIDGFQVSVGQFNFTDRVRQEAAAFLLAQAQAILFVFPCAYDIQIHVGTPFSNS